MNKIENKHPVDRALKSYFPLLVILLGVLIACVSPNDRNLNDGFFGVVVSITNMIIPSIHTYVEVSSFPNRTECFLVIMWSTLPLIVWGNLWMLGNRLKNHQNIARRTKAASAVTHPLILALAGAILLAITVVFPIVGLPISKQALESRTVSGAILRAISESPLWLGLCGSAAVWMCSLGIACVIRVLTRAIVKRNSFFN